MNLAIFNTVLERTDVEIEDVGAALAGASATQQASFLTSFIRHVGGWDTGNARLQSAAIADAMTKPDRAALAKFLKTLTTSLEASI